MTAASRSLTTPAILAPTLPVGGDIPSGVPGVRLNPRLDRIASPYFERVRSRALSLGVLMGQAASFPSSPGVASPSPASRSSSSSATPSIARAAAPRGLW